MRNGRATWGLALLLGALLTLGMFGAFREWFGVNKTSALLIHLSAPGLVFAYFAGSLTGSAKMMAVSWGLADWLLYSGLFFALLRSVAALRRLR